jgi:hypothetical protein
MEQFKISNLVDLNKKHWVLPEETKNKEIVTEIINKWFDTMRKENIFITDIPQGNVLRTLIETLNSYDIKKIKV